MNKKIIRFFFVIIEFVWWKVECYIFIMSVGLENYFIVKFDSFNNIWFFWCISIINGYRF